MADDVLDDGQRHRVAEVFTTHRQFIEAVARQHAHSPDQVPDIVQSVALQVCRNLNGFREEAQIRTWLFRVTANTARSAWRSESRHRSRVDAWAARQPTVVEPDHDDQLDRDRRKAALHDAVQQVLNPLYRDALRNQLDGGGVLGGKKTTRHRARRALRDLLQSDPRLTD